MIKVFLVEDEKIIRKSIKNNVKWEENVRTVILQKMKIK